MRHRLAPAIFTVAIVALRPGCAQSFDVASVKPAAAWRQGGEGSKRSRVQYTPASLSLMNVDAGECIQWAYGVKPFQISGPAFLDGERFDILAKTAAPVPVSRLRKMLQNLLASRFQLTLHRETRMLPVYELVAAKGGPKLPDPKDSTSSPVHASETLPRVERGSFVFEDTSMPEFAEQLSQLRGIDLPVVDHTGIGGTYDLTLKSAASAILQPDGPSLFSILQDQLGLRLVPAKAPFEVLVIDRIVKPSEN